MHSFTRRSKEEASPSSLANLNAQFFNIRNVYGLIGADIANSPEQGSKGIEEGALCGHGSLID
jgi:hypothetical protein